MCLSHDSIVTTLSFHLYFNSSILVGTDFAVVTEANGSTHGLDDVTLF